MYSRAIEAAQVSVNAIILTTTAALLSLPGPLVARAGQDAWLAVLAGTLLTMAYAWLLWALYFRPERSPGEPDAAGRVPWQGRALALAFGAYAIYLGVLLVAQVATVFATVLPEMPIAVFAAGTALTGWVLCAYGREALFRTGQALFPLMVLASLVNLAFSLAGNVDPRELLPVLADGVGPVLGGVPLVFGLGSEALMLTAVAGAVRDPRRLGRTLPLAVGLSGSLLAAYTAAAVAVLGTHEVARSSFPVLTLSRQVRVSLFLSRVEILTLFAWLTGAFVKEGLLLAAAAHGLTRALGLGDRRHAWAAAAAGGLTALLGVFGFSNAPRLLEHVSGTFPTVAGLAAAAFLAAGLLDVRGRSRRRWSRAATAGLLLLALLTAGCYGRVEPEQAAVATVLGLDRGARGGVVVTVEVVGAPAGAFSERAGAISHGLLRAEGHSLLDAQRRLELGAAREVLWSHVNVVVVGADLAREGLWPVLDALTRRYTFRRNAFLFVTDGAAGDLLRQLAPAFGAPRFAAFQRAILRPSGRTGPATDLNAFLRTLAHEGEDPYLPVVETSPPDSAEPALRRAGLFRRDRLVVMLPEPATLGLYWLTGQQELERLQWPCPHRPALRGMGVTALRTQASRQAGVDADGPWAAVRVHVEADVEEWRCPAALSPSALAEGEEAAARWIEGEVRALLEAARPRGVDPAGLGAALRRADPRAWAAVRDRWRSWLPHLRVDIRVDVRLRRTGLTLEPP